MAVGTGRDGLLSRKANLERDGTVHVPDVNI